MEGAERRLLAWVAAGCAAALMLAAPAGAAAPRAGKRYDGRSATGQRIFFKVSADATQLADYDVVVRMSCSDGRRRPLGLFREGEAPTTIGATGRFSYTSQPGPFTYRRGNKRLSGTARTSFSGSFDSPDLVSGTISSTFQGGGVSCSSGPVAYTAYRDGTRGAPFRRTNLATGLYTARGRGASVRARAFAPISLLSSLRVRTRIRCHRGKGYTGVFSYEGFPLRGGVFKDHKRSEFPVGSRRSINRTRVRVRFRRSNGVYRVRGTVRVTSALRRGSRKVDTCASGLRHFQGRLRSGPSNEF